jgi:NAD(P)-dependent dehydrogenase (short-subunit alcohol dehydrogenase family)
VQVTKPNFDILDQSSNPFSLEKKLILVTGASSGIGRQCSISCKQQGANVIIMGRNRERLNETRMLMNDAGNQEMYAFDLTEYDAAEKIIKEIVARNGKINGLINCAGISTTLPFNMATPGRINEFFAVNVQATFNLARIVVRQTNISEKGASIIFVSSVMGEVGEVGKSIYSITKGALIAGSRSLALELAPRRVRVNCVSPGVVMTPMSMNSAYSRNEEALNKIRNLHPLGFGQPEDVANACLFLLSDASKWITGINLIIDGGYTAR